MNIKWVQSRSSKKKEKNKEQSFLRWYEDGKERSKKLEGLYKFTGRLNPKQRTWNNNVDIDVSDILNQNKKELATGLFDTEKWDKTGRSFVDYGNEYINRTTLVTSFFVIFLPTEIVNNNLKKMCICIFHNLLNFIPT